MVSQIIILTIQLFWLFITGYGINNHIPGAVSSLLALLWFLSLYFLVHERTRLRISAPVKVLSLCLIPLMVIASAANAYEMFEAMAPAATEYYQKIALILADSMVAAVISSLTVSFLIAAIFHKKLHFVLVLVGTVPISAIQVMDAFAGNGNLFSYLLVAFEIVFRFMAIWIGTIFASAALTMHFYRRQAVAATFRD